jgi:hypothetical protein
VVVEIPTIRFMNFNTWQLLIKTPTIIITFLLIALLQSTRPSDHTTHCPFKGDAPYRSVRVGDRFAEKAAWSYPELIDSSALLVDYAAFYWDKMGFVILYLLTTSSYGSGPY